MTTLNVQWYEGLFLRPQHFQASERYWSERLHQSQRWDHPHHFGLRTVSFSDEALRNHKFEIKSLQARMRDGTLVDIGVGNEPDRIDLKPSLEQLSRVTADLSDALDSDTAIRIYLAVPKLQLGRENVSDGGPGDETRFIQTVMEVHDENRGGSDQQIYFRNLNTRILLSTDDLSGYELLPIAQVRRANEREAAPIIDDEYVPPVLTVAAWPGLGRDRIRAIYDIIGQKIEVISEQLRDRGVVRHSSDPADAERVSMLERLNEAYSTLGVIAFTDGVHPLDAYTELCRIVGQLSIFGDDRRARELPPYDHENLGPIFTEIRRRIEELIYSVRDYEYQQRYFVGVGMGIQVALEPRWFNSDWNWFIGVQKGELTEQECRTLLSPGHLDWKLGSSRQVEILFQRRASGIGLKPVQRAIRALPARPDWVFYEVARDDSPAWRDVQETQTMAMRFKDSLIMNQDRLQGEKRLVVNANGRPVTLQFALFAIPNDR
ncbi:MAG: type VI secretion system baseplate subunit TssK [Planctomycetales bacterium]|nr:type VI secretion system baseplate subunit TssK [Planctomycetales bacterium]